MHGYNVTKKDYISHLLETSSFLFLQEHWLNNAQLNTFSNAFPGYCIHGVSAIDSSVLLRGRPHGGVLIMFPDTYGSKVTIIQTVSKRLCAIQLKLDNLSILMFCIYLPCDTNDHNLLEEYQSVLSEISLLCVKYNIDNICIAGDLNTDFAQQNSQHTQLMLKFIDDEDLLNIIMLMLDIHTIMIITNHVV